MKNIKYIVIFASIWLAAQCTQKYNVVRMRNDKYLQNTKYSLATDHKMQGPGNYFTNYGKGVRKMRLDYSREIKDQKIIMDEIKMMVQLYDDDPQVETKLVILIDEKPIQVNDINWSSGNKNASGTNTSTQYGNYTDSYGKSHSGPHQVTSSYSVSYKTANCTLIPPEQLKTLFKNATAIAIRIYIGADVATAVFNQFEIDAVKKFYSNQVDEELMD
jgi:hypothetical protein